ncbi:MAG TPA: hypothetical protein VNY05_03170 [Candidatus Acidoferrales bacterium]|nr:hypothetical protein [Candidatus Acidoferrales bacterium]
MKNLTTALLYSVLSIAALGRGFAGAIPVPNFSFEDSAPGFGNPTGWTLFNSSSSPTFSSDVLIAANGTPLVSGVAGSQFAVVDLDHNNTSPANPVSIVPPNGSLDGLTSDNLGIFAANMLYTLTASVGLQNASSLLDVGLALGTGAPALADVFPAPGQPSFAFALINGGGFSDNVLQDETITLNTNTFPGLVGQPINASLIFHSEQQFGRHAIFDNVRLSSSTAAPEPVSLMLSVVGLLVLGSVALRERRNARPA